MEDISKLLIDNNRYLIVFIIFAVCDMLTGVIGAIISKELQSSKFREGMLKKTLEVVMILVAFCCDWAFNVIVVGKGTTVALVMMEAWSILENIEKYVPIPSALKQFLESIKNNTNNVVK